MSLAGNEIKRIAESLGMIYFRSININDLNEQVGGTDLEGQTLCVYANTPVISNETFAQASGVLQQYQVEIYFLQLNFYTDDTGTQIDTILDATNALANSFYDEMKRSPIIQGFIDDYDLEGVETIKMTKEVLSGWQMTITLPIPRTEFYCPPTTITGTFVQGIDQVGGLRLTLISNNIDFQVGDTITVNSDDGNYLNAVGTILFIDASINTDIPFTVESNEGTYSKDV